MQNARKQNVTWWRKSCLFGVAAGTSLLMAAGSAWAQHETMEEDPFGGGLDQSQQQPTPGQQPDPTAEPTASMEGDTNQQISELRKEVQELKALYSSQLFADFVNDFQREEAFQEHTGIYAVRGLRHLAFTIGQIIPAEDQQLSQRQEELQNRVLELERLPQQQQQQRIGELFVEAANLLNNVQQQYYPQFQQQAQQLMQTAQQMQDVEQLQEEAQRVNNFMMRASLAVERMAQTPTDAEAIGGGPLEGMDDPSVDDPTVPEPGMEEPGIEEPGMEEPGIEEPGIEEPGVEEEPGVPGEPIERDQEDPFGGDLDY